MDELDTLTQLYEDFQMACLTRFRTRIAGDTYTAIEAGTMRVLERDSRIQCMVPP